MITTATYSDPDSSRRRLSELGWTENELVDVVHAAVNARYSCTANDPVGAPGWESWRAGIRRMREIGLLKGFVRRDYDGIPCIVDESRNLRFTVANMDEGTGLENQQPSNRNKKGAATARLVHQNDDPFELIRKESLNVRAKGLPQKDSRLPTYWHLCIFCDEDSVRAELSCPADYEGGYITQYHERIIIIGEGDENNLARATLPIDDGGEEFEIQVIRKSS